MKDFSGQFSRKYHNTSYIWAQAKTPFQKHQLLSFLTQVNLKNAQAF